MLYAGTPEDNLHDSSSVLIGSNCIGIEAIDLNRDFNDIAGQLENIINKVSITK